MRKGEKHINSRISLCLQAPLTEHFPRVLHKSTCHWWGFPPFPAWPALANGPAPCCCLPHRFATPKCLSRFPAPTSLLLCCMFPSLVPLPGFFPHKKCMHSNASPSPVTRFFVEFGDPGGGGSGLYFRHEAPKKLNLKLSPQRWVLLSPSPSRLWVVRC